VDEGAVRVRAGPAIWSELLRIELIGIEDDFLELGGDSLLMTRLLTRLNTAFEIEMPLETLFRERTIARQAHTIELRILEEIEENASHAP
jgi:phthiocerol/phenolphthiocerol synthesis type-I polyketide synthase E